MRKRTLGRECAIQLLYQLEMNPEPVEEALHSFWVNHPMFAAEVRSFTKLLVEGTLKYTAEIDAIVQLATDNWELKRMAVIDRNILRFATFELLYVEDIPPKVTINEAVNLAKKFSQQDSGKFVNGVLDKINHTEKTRFVISSS